MKYKTYQFLVLFILLSIISALSFRVHNLNRTLSKLKNTLINNSERNHNNKDNTIISTLKSIPYNNTSDQTPDEATRRTYVAPGSISVTDRKGIYNLGIEEKNHIINLYKDRYKEVFNKFDLPDKIQDELIEHLGNIQANYSEASQFMIRHQQSKLDYDKKLRSLLTENEYKEYLDYELTKNSQEEYNLMIESDNNNLIESINDTDKEILIKSIKETEGFVVSDPPGPYGKDPNVAAGTIAIIDILKTNLKNIENKSSQVLGSASNLGISNDSWEKLVEFYSEKYSSTDRQIRILEDRLKNPQRHLDIINAPKEKREEMMKNLEIELGIVQ